MILMGSSRFQEMKKQTLRIVAKVRHWTRAHVPFGLRLPLGLVIIALGFLGFLPVLGFWMIPVGIAVAALDVAPMWRWMRDRLRRLPAATPLAKDHEARADDKVRIGRDG